MGYVADMPAVFQWGGLLGGTLTVPPLSAAALLFLGSALLLSGWREHLSRGGVPRPGRRCRC